MKQELRQILKVPKDLRIAQHIYNQCREYEDGIGGIDIFYLEDDEFISLMEKGYE